MTVMSAFEAGINMIQLTWTVQTESACTVFLFFTDIFLCENNVNT